MVGRRPQERATLRRSRLLAILLLVVALALVVGRRIRGAGSPSPETLTRPVPAASEPSGTEPEDLARDPSTGEGIRRPGPAPAPGDVDLLLVDRHTELPMAELRLVLRRSESGPDEAVLVSDGEGRVSAPVGEWWVAPEDGYSFVPRSVSITRSAGSVRLEGRFRVRAVPGGGYGWILVRSTDLEHLRRVGSGGAPDPERGEQDLGTLTDRWVVLDTREGAFCLVVRGDVRVEPAHAAWAGTVRDDEEGGTRTASPGRATGDAFASRAFRPVAGSEVEITVFPAPPPADLEVVLVDPESEVLVVLLERRGIAGTGSVTVQESHRVTSGGGARATLLVEDVPAGDYDVCVRSARDGVVRVGAQRVSIEGTRVRVEELEGLGSRRVRFRGDGRGWTLHAVQSRESADTPTLRVELPVASIRELVGVLDARCSLWLTREGAGGLEVESIDVEVGSDLVIDDLP